MREIICNNFFPLKHNLKKALYNKKVMSNTCILSLGGNVGEPLKTFKSLFQKIKKDRRVDILSTSPIYKNPPFGYTKQNDFYNIIMIISTNLCLIELYAFIFYLERVFKRGRKREFKNAPRTIDIDIIFFNDIYIRTGKLNIPHPKMWERDSVLVPLLYNINYKGI